MITQKTAEDIWHCYREIAAGDKLLTEMEALEEKNAHRPLHERQLQGSFGKLGIEMGVPNTDDSRRIFNVDSELAKSIIRSHIATKKQALVTVNERARIEIDSEAV